MRINFNLRPSGNFYKKIIILILFAIACMFINSCTVHAEEDYLNLYNYVNGWSFLYNNCPTNSVTTKLSHWGFTSEDYNTLLSNEELCKDISNRWSPSWFITNAIDNGFRYVVLVYISATDLDSGYNYNPDNMPIIFFFRQQPILRQTVSHSTSNGTVTNSTEFEFLDSNRNIISYDNGDVLAMNTNSKDFNWSNYFGIYSHQNSSGSYFGEYDVLTLKSNFDLYYTDGTLASSNSSIGFLTPSVNQDIYTPWFQKVIDAVLSIPSAIGNFFQSLFDFIKDLFVPPTNAFNDFLNTEYEYMQDKLGFLFYPITLITDFINRFYNIPNSGSAIFTIPTVSLMGTTLINSTSVDLLDIVNSNNMLQYVYSLYKIVVSGLIVLAIAKLAHDQFDKTIGGNYK